MKTFRWLIALLILAAAAFLLWMAMPHKAHESSAERPAANATADKNDRDAIQTVESQSSGKRQAQPGTAAKAPAGTRTEVSEAVRIYVQNKMADPQYDWKQPINFYGKVVNQSNAAIAGANISFVWNDISEKGTSEANTTSDGNGLFALTERRGKRLYVEVGKQGYYNSHQNGAFEYANPADGLFTPDSANPVVFYLRKKGPGTDLITSEYGMKDYFGVTMPLSNTPVPVDLVERRTGQGGQLKLSQTKPEYGAWKQATSWSFRMEIPDGGFVEENDEFPFEAPEDGYQTVLEFHFQKAEPDWKEDVRKDYYIKFGNPTRYGRLHLETSILMSGARLTYAINPGGSRYLEPK